MPGVRAVIGISKLLAQFGVGYTVFGATGRTPHYAYDSMRQLYCRTNGRMNDWMARWSRLRHRPYRLNLSTSAPASPPRGCRTSRSLERHPPGSR